MLKRWREQRFFVHAAAWLSEHAHTRASAQSFACLEDCGFCCTYPPQVTDAQAEAITAATGVDRFDTDATGEKRLPLQGGCGGCVLLEERECTAYELRPKHCRLFPFHVYFGRTVEVHADRVCPGLDPDPDQHGSPADEAEPADIEQALEAAVDTVDVDELDAHHRQALDTHERFEQIARDAGVWAEPDRARERALAEIEAPSEDAFERALEPLASPEDVQLPTMVLDGPDFEYRAWRLEGDEIVRLRFTEEGRMQPVGRIERPARPRDLPEEVRTVTERLVAYECFLGAALDRVDASQYQLRVEDAVRETVEDLAASLALRVPLVEAEGLEPTAERLAAAYEPAFFDLPTIGGWL